ncbi:MAG: MFS transporter [Pelolinea sp.]|nr:MFS transporter [Pelolinea sp.]
MNKLKSQFIAFPRTFRILIAATFIDRLGGGLIFPFLSLYVAQRFNVGMTEIGLLFGTWSISSLIGSTVGGALADKFGRKIILIFGLLFSAGTALTMGFVNDIRAFYFVAIFAGLFSDIGHPAQQAMVADLLKGEQRSEGFSLLRVVANLAVTIGPAIGGLLAGVSYLLLFILDACASTITALIVFKSIPETKPERSADHPSESLLTTLSGYGKVIKDRFFMSFIFASIIMIIVYAQMYSTLSVYLFKVHDIPAKDFGFMMSMNAAMVVLFQFWITRKIKNYQPLLLMIVATVLYGIGFSMFGFVSSFGLFMLAMAIITIGEMVHIPTAQALVAYFAPEDMRARYMAAFGYTWAIPNAVAPTLAGLIMDNYDPRLVWYLAGLLSVVAACAFAFLYNKTKHRFAKAVEWEIPPLQPN